MASRTETSVVNVAGLVQGIVLVTFPAASTIFTSRADYGLSSTLYGAMFLPQVAMAIAASLLGARLAVRISAKRVYVLGLSASLVSMALLLGSVPAKASQAAAYPLLLIATAFLGAGFGLTVPVLNTFTSVFHPDRVDRSVLVLNALLGLGTVLAPAFVAIFVGLGFWWGLPILSVALLVLLLLVSVRLPLRAGAMASAARKSRGRGIPARFWAYAAFAVLYGICETMNGNWSQLDMTTRLGASATEASLALTVFWGMVTAGRVLFASVGRWLAARVIYHILPFILVAAFLLTGVLPRNAAVAGILVFGLAGLGCSALLPLTISFGEEELTRLSAATAGAVIAFYQVGYGLAAFGVGPLQKTGLSLRAIFGLTAIVAAALSLLSFVVARGRPVRPTRCRGAPSGHQPTIQGFGLPGQDRYDPRMAGSGTAGAGQSRREARRPSAVLVPAVISGCVGLGLATTGFWGVGFGIATSCTDLRESLHGCDAMYHWMHVGRIGQLLLVLPLIAALVAGLAWPASRKAMAVSIWALTAVALAWFTFYMSSAASTF